MEKAGSVLYCLSIVFGLGYAMVNEIVRNVQRTLSCGSARASLQPDVSVCSSVHKITMVHLTTPKRRLPQNSYLAKVLFIISVTSFGALLIVHCNTGVSSSLVFGDIDSSKMQDENNMKSNYNQYGSQWHTLSSADMKMISEEMKRRRTRISSLCHSNGLNLSNIMATPKLRIVVQSLFLDKKYKIAWCPVYKASSSAWMEMFATLSGVITPGIRQKLNLGILQPNKVARKAYPKGRNISSALEDLANATRFMIVRHPFERLLSAYRDKLQNRKGREFYYTRFGRSIVRLYRNKSVHSDKLEPTFEEFLRYVVHIRPNQEDEHWRPYTASCAPCDLDYHYILKTESLDTEESFLITKFNLQSVFPSKVSKRNVNPKGHTGPKYIQDYYSSIPKSLLYRVYQHYEDDFKLFNYSPYDYLQLDD